MNHWIGKAFVDISACICLLGSGITLCSLSVPDMYHLGEKWIRVCGVTLILLTLGPILTHLNWINMKKEFSQALAEQARWELEVEYQAEPDEILETKHYEAVEEYSLGSTVATAEEGRVEDSLEEEFEEIIIKRCVVKHPPRSTTAGSKQEEVPIWKRLAGKGDGYEEFWLAEDDESISEGVSLPEKWRMVEDRYEEIHMEVFDVSDELDSSPEKKSLSEPPKKMLEKPKPNLAPAPEKPKEGVARKPAAEPQQKMQEPIPRTSSKMIETLPEPEEKAPQLVSSGADPCLEIQSEVPIAPASSKMIDTLPEETKPQLVSRGVDPCLEIQPGVPEVPKKKEQSCVGTLELQEKVPSASFEGGVPVSKPELKSTSVSPEQKSHEVTGTTTDPQILPNKVDTGVNPDEAIQESLRDNKRINTATDVETIPVSQVPEVNESKSSSSQSVRREKVKTTGQDKSTPPALVSSDITIVQIKAEHKPLPDFEHEKTNQDQPRATSSQPRSDVKPKIMTKPDKEMLHRELSQKIQAREEVPLRERLLIEEQQLKVEKISQQEGAAFDSKISANTKGQGMVNDKGQGMVNDKGQGMVNDKDQSLISDKGQGMVNDKGQSMVNETDPRNIKSDSDSSEFATPQSSPEQPCIAIKRIDRTKEVPLSQFSKAKDMIETKIDAETKSAHGAASNGELGQDSWVQSVVEKLSSEPGTELHVKTVNREENTTKEKITLRDDDTNELKIEEKVITDIAEEQMKIDKTF